MKKLMITLFAIIITSGAWAQPSNKEALEKSGSTLPNAISSKVTGPGKTVFNNYTNNEEYLVPIQIVIPSHEPPLKMEQNGYAVYEINGNGDYRFYKFRVQVMKFLELPQVTEKEIIDVVSKDWASFYGHLYNNIVDLQDGPRYIDEPYIRWHNVKSVEVYFKIKAEVIISDVETEVKDQVISVRLYRANKNAPWHNFYAMAKDHVENKSYGVKKLTPQEITKLRSKTLGNDSK